MVVVVVVVVVFEDVSFLVLHEAFTLPSDI
jgi:hypothetical protein